MEIEIQCVGQVPESCGKCNACRISRRRGRHGGHVIGINADFVDYVAFVRMLDASVSVFCVGNFHGDFQRVVVGRERMK